MTPWLIAGSPPPPISMSRLKQLYVSLARQGWDRRFWWMLVGMEAVLCWAVVKWVPYTEIDWEAYMQEVDGYRGGERDYLQIRGGTGPLVYPAGFLYLYDGLRAMAGGGGDECESDGSDSDSDIIIRRVQHMFCVLYVLHAAVVLQLYTTVARRCATALSSRHSPQDKLPLSDDAATTTAAHVVWMWRVAMGICCASKRMHSIFVLRLFNDAPAMFLLYLSTLLFSRNCWRRGCVLYSLGVSIKMNVLLFAPGLLLLLLQATPNVYETILCLSICAMVQLVLGAPFLLTYPVSYIRKAFEFDRVFFYKWTVNWKFLPEDVFVSKPLSVALLLLHIVSLMLFAKKWILACQRQTKNRQCLFLAAKLTPEYVGHTLFVANYIGICFARTLHYQFYSWYFHTIPWLVCMSLLPSSWPSSSSSCSKTSSHPLHTIRVTSVVLLIAFMAAIEYSFNVFPATATSSAILQLAHFLILWILWRSKVPEIIVVQPPNTTVDSSKKMT